jgi:hypothetical protein
MDGEKIGGYESRLSPRGEDLRRINEEYNDGWSNGEAIENPESAHLIEYILSTLDFEKLKGVFLEELRKSGVPEENINIGVLDKIIAFPNGNDLIGSMYYAFINRIAFSANSKSFIELKQQMIDTGRLSPDILMGVQLLFIHEVCHAFSRVRVDFVDVGENASIYNQNVGYSVSKISIENGEPASSVKLFETFNEGVTQRIAEEVFLEYSKRVGISEEIKSFLIKLNSSPLSLQYRVYENQVDLICERISDYVGIPKDVVWKGFKRGYFEKPELFHKETLELFRDTFGDDFLDNYMKFDYDTPMSELAKFDATNNFKPVSGYSDKWLKCLGIFKGVNDK